MSDPDVTVPEPWLSVLTSRFFLDWLLDQRLSFAFTTYQTGKLFFVGRNSGPAISVFERTYNHCMGLWASADARTLWLSTWFQIWRLERATAQVVPHIPAEAMMTRRHPRLGWIEAITRRMCRASVL